MAGSTYGSVWTLVLVLCVESGSAASSCVTVVFLNAGSAALSESGCYDNDRR